jgi:hypothetical protein
MGAWRVSGTIDRAHNLGRFGAGARLGTPLSVAKMLAGSPQGGQASSDICRDHSVEGQRGRDDDGHLATGQIGCERRQPVIAKIRPPVFRLKDFVFDETYSPARPSSALSAWIGSSRA